METLISGEIVYFVPNYSLEPEPHFVLSKFETTPNVELAKNRSNPKWVPSGMMRYINYPADTYFQSLAEAQIYATELAKKALPEVRKRENHLLNIISAQKIPEVRLMVSDEIVEPPSPLPTTATRRDDQKGTP